jgi:hypothetical protein
MDDSCESFVDQKTQVLVVNASLEWRKQMEMCLRRKRAKRATDMNGKSHSRPRAKMGVKPVLVKRGDRRGNVGPSTCLYGIELCSSDCMTRGLRCDREPLAMWTGGPHSQGVGEKDGHSHRAKVTN